MDGAHLRQGNALRATSRWYLRPVPASWARSRLARDVLRRADPRDARGDPTGDSGARHGGPRRLAAIAHAHLPWRPGGGAGLHHPGQGPVRPGLLLAPHHRAPHRDHGAGPVDGSVLVHLGRAALDAARVALRAAPLLAGQRRGRHRRHGRVWPGRRGDLRGPCRSVAPDGRAHGIGRPRLRHGRLGPGGLPDGAPPGDQLPAPGRPGRPAHEPARRPAGPLPAPGPVLRPLGEPPRPVGRGPGRGGPLPALHAGRPDAHGRGQALDAGGHHRGRAGGDGHPGRTHWHPVSPSLHPAWELGPGEHLGVADAQLPRRRELGLPGPGPGDDPQRRPGSARLAAGALPGGDPHGPRVGPQRPHCRGLRHAGPGHGDRCPDHRLAPSPAASALIRDAARPTDHGADGGGPRLGRRGRHHPAHQSRCTWSPSRTSPIRPMPSPPCCASSRTPGSWRSTAGAAT